MVCNSLLMSAITNEPVDKFLNAIDIFVNNQNALNKKLAGSSRSYYGITSKTSSEVFDLLFEYKTQIDFSNKERLLEFFTKQEISFSETEESQQQALKRCMVVVSKLIPKNVDVHTQTYIICVIDATSSEPSMYVLNLSNDNLKNLAPEFPYRLHYHPTSTELSIHTQKLDDACNPKSIVFLKTILFKKLLKWMQNPMDDKADSVKSLCLIAIEEYNQLYGVLKDKYGARMVKMWPETTDPKKYVYEDIAIAAYLLVLWKNERTRLKSEKLQSFVDLGCGNGLLVYILSSEGHAGYGIDLRKRGIWDLYPKTTLLKIESIVPSNSSLFPNVDYIIGNHSDELSPWIPVIAARSSYTTNFFLLPCCAFDFDGRKYQRKSCNKSQYNDFLEYVQEISKVCGFNTSVDRLKIPSTKRICVIGDSRSYEASQFDSACEKIQKFIDGRCNSQSVASDLGTADNWSEHFKPRESVEKVRNCTQIDKSVVEDIVKLVFDNLIIKKRHLPDFHNPTWNCGSSIALPELAKKIPGDMLKKLKSECGGLQTLLKNHHQIFEIQGGVVKLRLPKRLSEKRADHASKLTVKDFIFKQKNCWFLLHHPDGCPFMEEECSYKH